jgi:hypothetical protein
VFCKKCKQLDTYFFLSIVSLSFSIYSISALLYLDFLLLAYLKSTALEASCSACSANSFNLSISVSKLKNYLSLANPLSSNSSNSLSDCTNEANSAVVLLISLIVSFSSCSVNLEISLLKKPKIRLIKDVGWVCNKD